MIGIFLANHFPVIQVENAFAGMLLRDSAVRIYLKRWQNIVGERFYDSPSIQFSYLQSYKNETEAKL